MIGKLLKAAALLAVVISAVRGEAAPAQFEIAEPGVALTFARPFEDGLPTKLLLVTAYKDGMVTGIDLSQALGRPVFDPAILYNEIGRQAILDALAVIPDEAAVTVPAESLGMPVGLSGHHIAVGANFPEHAEDATVEEGPFLFPKLVHPTAPYEPIPRPRDALLDYEAELCFVPMRAFPPIQPSRNMGLILCNDVTDRAVLLRKLDAFDIESGKGFPDGKSAPGFLPVGNLFVIPSDTPSFVRGIELSLEVNGELRQQAPMTRAVWDLPEILRQTEARKTAIWSYGSGQVRLPMERGRIPARSLIMAGTPSGTVFNGVRTMHQLGGAVDWLFGGWDRPLQQWVVDRYITEERELDRYLKVGDEVTIYSPSLGLLRNRVGE